MKSRTPLKRSPEAPRTSVGGAVLGRLGSGADLRFAAPIPASVTYAHEVVLNSYTKTAGLPLGPADAYWSRTKDYWAAVRVTWDEAARRHASLAVRA